MAPHPLRWILIGAAAAAAAAAAGLGAFRSEGEVDRSDPSPGPAHGDPAPPPPPRRPDLPRYHFGVVAVSPESERAQKALQSAWETAATARPPDVAAALDALAPPAGRGPLSGFEARVITCFAPVFEHLAIHGDPPIPAAVLRCAASLSRSGGPEARKALAKTNLVSRALALQATVGTEEYRREAARLLGFCGGPEAAAWLARVIEKAPEDSVRETAVHALAEVSRGGTRLGADPVAAVRGALAGSAGRPALRRACLGTVRRALPDFRAWFQIEAFQDELIACLADADASVRYEAAWFLDDCPLERAGPALVKAGSDPEERVVGKAADAIRQLRPAGAADALRARRPSLKDPEAIRSVEAALRALDRR